MQAGAKAAAVEGADPAALTLQVSQLAPAAAAAAAAPAAPAAAAPSSLEGRIKALLASAPLLLCMKGSKEAPYCGFSGRVVEALKKTGHDFASFDIFSDDAIRLAGLREGSGGKGQVNGVGSRLGHGGATPSSLPLPSSHLKAMPLLPPKPALLPPLSLPLPGRASRSILTGRPTPSST
jgi:hypothetical protein